MRWTERQRSMLRQIGIRLWLPEPEAATSSNDLETVSAEAEGLAGAGARQHAGAAAGAGAGAVTPRPATTEPGTRRDALEERAAVAPTAPESPRTGLHAGEPAQAWSRESPSSRAVDSARLAGPERAAAIASLEWSELRDSAALCTACALSAGRTRSVFASSAGRADWVIVGDPPSAQDDREGVPLAGDNGRLVDGMLRSVQRSRADVALPPAKACVTPIVKCRPPDDRAADSAEIAACAPYLERQLQLLQPKLLLAMGRCAAQGLLQTDLPVGKLRGSVHRVHGLPMVATFGPAHLARHPTDKAKAWDDLCRAFGATTSEATSRTGTGGPEQAADD